MADLIGEDGREEDGREGVGGVVAGDDDGLSQRVLCRTPVLSDPSLPPYLWPQQVPLYLAGPALAHSTAPHPARPTIPHTLYPAPAPDTCTSCTGQVCDVLEAILAPRPEREFIMIDPDIGHVRKR